MYSSIFTENEWKAPIQPVYRNNGCSTCGLGRYYNKESFRQFKFVAPSDPLQPSEAPLSAQPAQPSPTPQPTQPTQPVVTEIPVFQPDLNQLEGVVRELRALPVKQLIAVLEPILPQDLAGKYKSMFPKSLRRLIDSYSDRQIVQGILLLPQETIEAIAVLKVPQPMLLAKRASEVQLKVAIDPSFYNSNLFSTYKEIPRNDPNFSFMDPTFAIGNANSSYEPFNIIINLDFPYNGVEQHSITSEYTSDKKIILRVGIYDSQDEPMDQVLKEVVPFLGRVVTYHYNKPRILFHCRAGISRSASVAIAYYGKIMNYDLTRAYSQLASRRAIIQPNPGFIDALEEFLI